jgi:3-oxoacyl-[acyl-carrier-protein] synthase-3
MMYSQILATGSYLPERVVKNEDFTQFRSKSLPIIARKSGVQERRHADASQATSDLATQAAKACLCRAGIEATEIDGIILATCSPDQPIPATSAMIQAKIGAWNAFTFDINACCTGSLLALRIADTMLRGSSARRILVLAAEVLSRLQDPNNFSTYPYFGDGAGAVLLEAADCPIKPYITHAVFHSDGRKADWIRIQAGGSRMPSPQVTDPRLHYLEMSGRDVFDFAIARGVELIDELCQLADLNKNILRHLVLHQANIHIIHSIADKIGIPRERFATNLSQYANTGTASILIAFDELINKRLNQGMEGPCLLVGFGAGLTWGGLSLALP